MGKSTVVIFVRISEWQANHFVDFLLKFLIIKKNSFLLLSFPRFSVCVCVQRSKFIFSIIESKFIRTFSGIVGRIVCQASSSGTAAQHLPPVDGRLLWLLHRDMAMVSPACMWMFITWTSCSCDRGKLQTILCKDNNPISIRLTFDCVGIRHHGNFLATQRAMKTGRHGLVAQWCRCRMSQSIGRQYNNKNNKQKNMNLNNSPSEHFRNPREHLDAQPTFMRS